MSRIQGVCIVKSGKEDMKRGHAAIEADVIGMATLYKVDRMPSFSYFATPSINST